MRDFLKDKIFIKTFILSTFLLVFLFFLQVGLKLQHWKFYVLLFAVFFASILVNFISALNLIFFDFLSSKFYKIDRRSQNLAKHFWIFIPIYITFHLQIIYKIKIYMFFSVIYLIILSGLASYYYWKNSESEFTFTERYRVYADFSREPCDQGQAPNPPKSGNGKFGLSQGYIEPARYGIERSY